MFPTARHRVSLIQVTEFADEFGRAAVPGLSDGICVQAPDATLSMVTWVVALLGITQRPDGRQSSSPKGVASA
jgi:hypothetical protein